MGDTVRKLGTHSKGPGQQFYIRLPNPAYTPVVKRATPDGGEEAYPNQP